MSTSNLLLINFLGYCLSSLTLHLCSPPRVHHRAMWEIHWPCLISKWPRETPTVAPAGGDRAAGTCSGGWCPITAKPGIAAGFQSCWARLQRASDWWNTGKEKRVKPNIFMMICFNGLWAFKTLLLFFFSFLSLKLTAMKNGNVHIRGKKKREICW